MRPVLAKLLVVEDNGMSRRMLTRRLLRLGYRVTAVSDGAEVVVAAERDQPDVILMDMNLPHVDGWTATRTLKSRPATCGIPIIALTAHAMTEDRQRALDAGCDDYDTKPVDLPRLLSKIAAFVGPEALP